MLKEWHSWVLAATLTPLKHWMGRLDSNQRITEFKAPRLTYLATAQQTFGWPSWIRTRHSTFRESRDAASLTANNFETGSESRIRTCDRRINSALPYRLATSEKLNIKANPGTL